MWYAQVKDGSKEKKEKKAATAAVITAAPAATPEQRVPFGNDGERYIDFPKQCICKSLLLIDYDCIMSILI